MSFFSRVGGAMLSTVSGLIDIPMEGMGGPTTRSNLIPRNYDFPTARGVGGVATLEDGAVLVGNITDLEDGASLVGNVNSLRRGAIMVGNITDLDEGAALVGGWYDEDGYYHNEDEEDYEAEEEVFEEDAALDPLVFFAGPGWSGPGPRRTRPVGPTPRRFPRAHFRGSPGGGGGGRRFGGGGGGFRGGHGGGGRRR